MPDAQVEGRHAYSARFVPTLTLLGAAALGGAALRGALLEHRDELRLRVTSCVLSVLSGRVARAVFDPTTIDTTALPLVLLPP